MQQVVALASHTAAIWWRQYLVWRKIIWPSLTTNVANPVLFLFAFGFGLGAVIGCRLAGAERIVAIDLSEERLAEARRHGGHPNAR